MKTPFGIRWQPSASLTRWLTVSAWILGVLAIFWVCTYKVMDRDFWWHITAGKILLDTHRMILIDPFAYTREGLPYLATHEWLAQILLYIIHASGGYTALILFRGVIACASMGLLLSLTKHKRIAYLILAVWAIVMTKGSFLERPQLFTFVIFAAFLLLAFRFLDAQSMRTRRRLCAGFVALELLWVNMHGGAALLGCAVVTFLLIETGVCALSRSQRSAHLPTLLLLAITAACMGLTLISPPNGFGTLTYITQLLNDKTIAFIGEWQPREWGLYVRELWPFFVLSVFALSVGKKHRIFNGLLLLATLVLSRQAFRHEILFVFVAVATCFYHLDRSEIADRLWTWIAQRRTAMGIATIILILFLSRTAYLRSFGFERQDNLFGFGQFDLARGAVDFIEREKIDGNMFNTYGIGGYLIYRGYPDRKVFIDGRNVDYGFDFLAHAYAAGVSRDQWDELVHQYDISYAIIDYNAIRQKDSLPYSSILDTHPDWAMIYLDDWVAVYLTKTPAHQAIINRLGYSHVDATTLQFHSNFSDAKAEDLPAIRKELQRIQQDNPEGIKATLALANIALHEKRDDDAKALLATARSVRPYDPEPLAILAGIHVSHQEWKQAADAFSEMLRLAGDNYPNMNYAFIAEVFDHAGHPLKAWWYRRGIPTSTSSLQTESGSLTGQRPSLSVNPASDALEFSDRGVAQAEANQFVEAEESFRTSLKINPGSAGTWNNLCALMLTLKRIPEAIDACKRAVAIDADFGDAHFNLALAYYRHGSRKEAEKEALRAQALGRKKESDELLLLIRKM